MLRENTVFTQKVLDFYAIKGVDCLVVDERQVAGEILPVALSPPHGEAAGKY